MNQSLVRSMVRAVASRIAAVLVATSTLWLAAHAGVEVTEDQRGHAVSFFTDALTGLGWMISMIIYPIVHKALNRIWNPVDSAMPPVPPPPAPVGAGWDY